MPFIECRHIFAGGRKCEAPSLRGERFCYFHARAHVKPATGMAGSHTQLTATHLEDADSVQLALSEVIAGIASGTLDPRRAGLLLYGLQVAAANVRHTRSRCEIGSVQDISVADDGTLLGPAVTSTSLDTDDEGYSCDDCIDDCDDDCDCECHDEEPEDSLDLARQGARMLAN